MSDFPAQMAALRLRFLARAEEELPQLLTAAERRDAEQIRLISHRLAGIAAIFGFPAVGRAASGVEDALDADAPPAEFDRHCEALVAELRAALGGLRADQP